MKVKCPNCMAALIFDAESGKMQCKYCNALFSVEDIENTAEEEQQSDTVECNIYTCTSCGAELAINGVESSTFCAYCGQPTIVFSRVSKTLKPEVIIPFHVEKEEAVEAIRSRFRQGFFIPMEVKAFEVERLHGIYIPYWLYDSYYYDKQLIKGTVGSGKHRRTRYFMREADCRFQKVSVDASKNLNDESSRRLEPYDMCGLKEFDIGYLSGYYSDRYDMSNGMMRSFALQRMEEMFGEQTMNSCNASDKSIVSSKPKVEIQKETYALFPAWFMTFRYENMPYTMMVNGQTGKVVGAVPYDRKKVGIVAAVIFLLTLLVSIPLGIAFCTSAAAAGEDFFEMLAFLIIVLFLMVSVGSKNWKKLQKSRTLSASQTISRYAHERQSGGGEFE